MVGFPTRKTSPNCPSTRRLSSVLGGQFRPMSAAREQPRGGLHGVELMGLPPNGWFILEHAMKIRMIWGPFSGNLHIAMTVVTVSLDWFKGKSEPVTMFFFPLNVPLNESNDSSHGVYKPTLIPFAVCGAYLASHPDFPGCLFHLGQVFLLGLGRGKCRFGRILGRPPEPLSWRFDWQFHSRRFLQMGRPEKTRALKTASHLLFMTTCAWWD